MDNDLSNPTSLKYILNLSELTNAFNGDSFFSVKSHFNIILLASNQSKLLTYLTFLASLSTILYLKVLLTLASSLGIELYI